MIKLKLNRAVTQKFLKKFDNITKNTDDAIDKAIQRAGRDLKSNAQRKAPFKRSHLRRSITARHRFLQSVVGSNLVYARIQDLGGMAGRGLKSKIKGNKYLTKAFKAIEDKLEKYFRQELKKLFKE